MTPPPGPKRRSQLTEDDYTRARCYLQLWSQAHWEHGEARRGLVIGCILVRQRLTDADILRLTGTYAPLHKIAQRWRDSPRRRWWRRRQRPSTALDDQQSFGFHIERDAWPNPPAPTVPPDTEKRA